MRLTLVAVPYDLGRESVGSGRGPQAYLEGGAVTALRARGHDARVVTAQRGAPFADELGAVLDTDADVAAHVQGAAAAGRLPLVLAGNCNVTLGVHAGLTRAAVAGPHAVVWLDAHGDFNTPATTLTGYLDGMPLAMLTGRAYPDLWERLGAGPLDERLVLHVGGRDLDPAERQALEDSDVTVVDADGLGRHGLGAALRGALDALAGRAREQAFSSAASRPPAHLHVDIDVLDPAAAPGVSFPAPGGLATAELIRAIALVRERFTLQALSLTSFDPARDRDGATLRAGLAVLAAVAED
jgi:arginase